MLAEKGAGADARIRLTVIGRQDSGWVNALRATASAHVAVVAALPAKGESGQWQGLAQAARQEDVAARGADGPVGAAHTQSDEFEQWRFEDEHGRPLFSTFFGLQGWQRRPFAMALRLVAMRGRGRVVLAEAWVGTRDSYQGLLAQLAQTAILLLAKAVSVAPPTIAPCLTNPAPASAPPMATMALFGGGLRREALRQSRRFAVETWAVGIAGRRIEEVLTSGDLGEVTWVPWDDRKGYLADPFPWPGWPDRFLCERLSSETGIGDLVAIDGLDGYRQTRIEIPLTGHLSYPCAWSEAGEVLLMPESGASRSTVIHRLGDDGRAKPWVTVAEGCGMADPTLVRRDSLYWIAYTDTAIGLHDNLCLMYAEHLQGPWHLHPGNPVKLDVRSSRPAGPFFESGGKLYRPAQDCAADYGAALAINRIVEWTTRSYREEVAVVLYPDPRGPYPHGLHTLSVWGDRLLIDGKRWQRRPDLLVDKILRRLRRRDQS